MHYRPRPRRWRRRPDPEQTDAALAGLAPNVPKTTVAALSPLSASECGKIHADEPPLIGQKISITSKKAWTTRHRVTGIQTTDKAQYILSIPWLFKTRHRNTLNRR